MLLVARHLTKRYRRATSDFAAVDQVDLELGEKDFFCITGHSGSGKSTLLNLIAGFLAPDEGTVLLDGEKLSALDDVAASYLRNTQIGYIPQGSGVLANFTVGDNVRLPFYLHRRMGDPAQRAQTLLEQMGIAHLANQYPAQLSGGELRRVSIARALINKPCLLLADEPTSDLDPDAREAVMELFSAIARAGTAVLVVTHEQENLRHATRHLIMASGRLSGA
ncbi:MAG: ABC transporter ATP-binding protein [Coriobacteriales bacterium]|jgi:putative ABC transport system ATP-binding protein|nr:ABC transporter ATP-binding protein [Coriobacteriales bacterium]